MARPHAFEVTDQPKVQSWFVPAGATGPKIEIRRQFGLRPIVTVDDKPVSAKWNLRASGVLGYLLLIVAVGILAGGPSADSLVQFVPIAVAFFFFELPWLGTYQIPLRDGTTATLRLKGAFRGIRALLDGVEVAVERQLSVPMIVLSYLPTLALLAAIFLRFLPFALGNTLGSMGVVLTGALGFVAFAGGQAIVRSLMRQGAQVIAVFALCVAVGGSELAMHYGTPVFPVGQVGTCLDLGGASSLSNSTTPVDCHIAHRSEVIGVLVFEDGPFPENLSETARSRCGSLFQAYVGIDPDRSELFLSWFEPSNHMWDLGARSVTCFTYLRDGTPLTQTVRGSRL